MLGKLFGNLKKLPKPLGKYVVGITQLDFTDCSRNKVFPFEEDDAFRKIPVTIFYPAESNENKDSAPYSSPELLETLFMLLGTHLIKNISRTTYIYNTEDTYMAILDNTQHLGYSDGLFIFRQGNIINQIGGREKYEFREIVTNCHLKFFEKYLLKNKEVELKDLRYDGFEFRQRLSKN